MYYDNRNNDKIKRRVFKNKKKKSPKLYIIIGIIALIIFVFSYLYLCIFVLAKSPDMYFETSMITTGII